MRGAIFDMDGLLIDSERVWQRVWHGLAAERGLTLAEAFPAEICGTSGDRTLEIVARHFRTDDPRTVLHECSERVRRLEEDGVPLKRGARTILEGMRAGGWRIAVASSSPMEMIRHNLRKDGIDGFFDELTSGREVREGKPAPDIFLLAAERIGMPPGDCYVFEDSLSGVEAGWRAGCRAVMIPDLVQPTEKVRAMCFGVYRDLGEAWEQIKGE